MSLGITERSLVRGWEDDIVFDVANRALSPLCHGYVRETDRLGVEVVDARLLIVKTNSSDCMQEPVY